MSYYDRSLSPTIDDHGEMRNMYGSHGKGIDDGGTNPVDGHEAREVDVKLTLAATIAS